MLLLGRCYSPTGIRGILIFVQLRRQGYVSANNAQYLDGTCNHFLLFKAVLGPNDVRADPGLPKLRSTGLVRKFRVSPPGTDGNYVPTIDWAQEEC